MKRMKKATKSSMHFFKSMNTVYGLQAKKIFICDKHLRSIHTTRLCLRVRQIATLCL